MTMLKNMMMKVMNKIMFDCDHATLLITKGQYERLGWLDRLKLKMHLASCKFCRCFLEQSNYISAQVDEFKTIDQDNLKIHLTETQKTKLCKEIEKQTINN